VSGTGVFAILLLAGLATGGAAQAQDGDAAAGEKVFNRCKACHMVGPDAKNRVGPILTGVVGRKAGTVEGFAYSEINKAAGTAGLTWTPEAIAAYLPDPQAFLESYLKEQGQTPSGRTKMAFRLAAEKDRKDVIAYLQTFSQ
jgi:cytochrome c